MVISCDKYSESWDLFFTLLFKYYDGLRYQVYLINENLQYHFEKVKTINTGEKVWSKRLLNGLKTIEEDYILLMLEDYFLQEKVNGAIVDKYLDEIIKNNRIASFYFESTTGYTKSSEKYKDFYKMEKNDINNGKYLLNCQAAIWKKDILKKTLSIELNPWEFENMGYNLYEKDLKQYEFYCYKYARYNAIGEKDIFSYLLSRDTGFGIYKSRWLWNNKRLFKLAGIKFKHKKIKKLTKVHYL